MPVDLQRRKVVMARSIKLGHCVCNPRQGCPCEILVSQNVCPCAGERAPVPAGPVPLTRHVRKAGCASKIGQADLKRILGRLPPITDPRVLLGLAAGDDAGVYRLDDHQCLVQTVDVFTPCVDDPYLFGQIAAANSVSDIYAMGGRPLTALSIVGFPIEELDGSVMEAMLRGGMDKLSEAACSLIGGHSLIDEEIKCGFAVTGLIESDQVVARDRAQPGDTLVLTKPLGTGLICFAAQIGRMSAAGLAEAGAAMATLNRDAAELMVQCGAHAATDITGFGLAGHLVEMARHSQVELELDLAALPVFAAARECLEEEILPGAIERNQEYSMAWVRWPETAQARHLPILYDPQTSGGLMISLPAARAEELVRLLRERGHKAAAIIGRVRPKDPSQSEGLLRVTGRGLASLPGSSLRPSLLQSVSTPSPAPAMPTPLPSPSPRTQPLSCCDGALDQSLPPGAAPIRPGPAGSVHGASRSEAGAPGPAFQDFLRTANQPGLIDVRHKKLMVIALSVAQRCEPCLRHHLKSALEMGVSKAEIDEAAWLGVAFAGSPAMMLYNQTCLQLGL
jgi:selenide, water dikinase